MPARSNTTETPAERHDQTPPGRGGSVSPRRQPPADRGGFTLVELAVVVVVIGILATIAIPNYYSMTENTRRGSCISNQRNLVGHSTLYAADHNLIDENVDVNDLFVGGILPADLCECPSSTTEDQDDYVIELTGGVVTDVTCNVRGEDHEWHP